MFGDAGLRDLAVESGIIAEGSISKVLEGKHYNRAVRLHKLVYEALMRLIWPGFIEWIQQSSSENVHHLEDVLRQVDQLHQNLNHANKMNATDNESWMKLFNQYISYLDVLRHERGQLTSFWMTYMDMVEILLGLIRADREGNWNLHLACIREMIPWCFAMNKTNYARYLPIYYATMSKLQETSPELHKHFLNKGFSAQLSSTNPFGRIAIDQATEETINKDTQTAGGTRGFSLKPGTVSRYYLTAEHRAAALRQLRDQVAIKPQALSHVDLGKTRIQKDESDVQSLVELLTNNWTNPFHGDQPELICISSGTAATPQVSSDLLTAHKRGQEAYKKFQERLEKGEGFYDPIKKVNMKTFSDMKKKTNIGKDRNMVLKADRRLFGNMVLIAQNRKLDMQKVLYHPLGPLPLALANIDGSLKKTNKSVLSNHLESIVSYAECVPPDQSAVLIDAMAIIQKLKGDNHTFDELSDTVLSQMLHTGQNCKRIDVVFDVYREESIKSAERIVRGSKEGIVFTQIKSGHKIKSWKKLLSSTESKNNLTKYLVNSWKDPGKRQRLGERTMFVTLGSQCIKLTRENWQVVDELTCSHEEADTRLLLHAKHAAGEYPTVVCVADDTDVFILLLTFATHIKSKILLRRGTKARVRLVDIKKVVDALGNGVCAALLGLHAWTGCDSNSALSGQGKIKALKRLQKESKFQETFANLGNNWILTHDFFDKIQAFTCQLYCQNTEVASVNELRYLLFCSRGGDVESGQLPPCSDTLRQHTLRANYQAAIWRRSLQQTPDIPDPVGHGWERDQQSYMSVKWMTGPPAPEVVLELMSCRCSRSCQLSDCSCLQNGLKCTPACRLLSCSNMENAVDDIQPDVPGQFAVTDEDDSDSDVDDNV